MVFFECLDKNIPILAGEEVGQTPMRWDIIFLDGLHHADQVERDIENSLKCLNPGGTIVCHDMLPMHEFGTIIPMRPDHNEWWGDVYKTWIKLRQTRSDLEMNVVDCDHGCGIIRKGSQQLLTLATIVPGTEITYQDFDRNRKEWMNVISVEEFRQRYL